jgi:hypothetical protein
MEKEQPIEKVYRLIETYDFSELAENDKDFVLEHISMEEYNEMRATITDTRTLLAKYPVEKARENRGIFTKFLTYPVELYKIAAIFLVLTGIGFMFFKIGTVTQSRLIAAVDTVFVEKTDTVVFEMRDTIRIVTGKAVYKDHEIPENTLPYHAAFTETVNYTRDCSIEICPGDMAMLSVLKTRNDFSRDTALKDFITAIY